MNYLPCTLVEDAVRVSPSSRYTESPIGNKVVRQRTRRTIKILNSSFSNIPRPWMLYARQFFRVVPRKRYRGFSFVRYNVVFNEQANSIIPHTFLREIRVDPHVIPPRPPRRHIMQRVRCTSHACTARARQDNFPPGVVCLIGATRDPGN